MPELILLDGSSYLHRAHFSLPPLNNAQGEPTGAIYGVINMLLNLIRQQSPHYIGVIFDAAGPIMRDAIRAEYNVFPRIPPEELLAQIEPLIEVVDAMGLPMLRIEGQEADDVIGTLACQAVDQGIGVTLSTCDKDMAQLVDDCILLVNSLTGEKLDREGVKEKYKVYPEKIFEYLALVGDVTDDIPGVERVGAKTALKWLEEFGSLEEVIAKADLLKGKGGESLRANLQAVELSRRLAVIHCDLPIRFELDGFMPRPPDIKRLHALYERLGLGALLDVPQTAADSCADAENAHAEPQELLRIHSILPALAVKTKTLPKQEDATPAPVERHYETIFTADALDRWIEVLKAAPLFAFDTETTNLNYMDAELVGLSFCVEPGYAAYVPMAHCYPGAPPQLSREQVLSKLKPILEDPLRSKVGHHLKYDAHILANYGIELNGMHYDSMIESYVFNSTVTRHDMNSVADKYLNVKSFTYEELCGKGKRQITIDYAPIERAAAYAAEDADISLQLHLTLWGKISRIASLKRLYESIEQPLVPVLKRMEENGVLIDCHLLKLQSEELALRMMDLQNAAHEEACVEFNLESPKQLREILFDLMQLPVLYTTPKGHPSTAEDVLEELALTYRLPRLVMEFRSLAKLKSTYIDKWPLQLNKRTGRLHTSYHNALASTGRIISIKPNLQTIPVRTDAGSCIRRAIIAPPGCLLMAADYSQIELRIMAHLSGDMGLIEAFRQDLDIHRATAAEVFGVPLPQVTTEQRRSAKTVNFGLMYGMSAFGLARQLGIEKDAAQEYIELYFDHYPQVRRYINETRAQARARGYVETLYGRRLHVPDIRSRRKGIRLYAERCAINAPMQGTTADIIKRAMIRIDRWIRAEQVPAKLIMQVHDELVLEVARHEVPRVAQAVQAHMIEAAELTVPVKVDIGVGVNWHETR